MKNQYVRPTITIEDLLNQDVLLSSKPSEAQFLNPEDRIKSDGNPVPMDLWSSIWGP